MAVGARYLTFLYFNTESPLTGQALGLADYIYENGESIYKICCHGQAPADDGRCANTIRIL